MLSQEDAAAWERWVFLYAQRKQLGALAEHLPTGSPQLRPMAYRMVRWPVEALMHAVQTRIRKFCGGGSSTRWLERLRGLNSASACL